MTDDAFVEGENRRRRRRVNKRSSRKRRKMIQNVRWIVGGLAIGLPFVLLMIYVMSALLVYF
jgi:hypothetical protein